MVKPATFDGNEKTLLLTMLAREGQEGIRRVRGGDYEFVARCFDLAAKVARTAGPDAAGSDGGR